MNNTFTANVIYLAVYFSLYFYLYQLKWLILIIKQILLESIIRSGLKDNFNGI